MIDTLARRTRQAGRVLRREGPRAFGARVLLAGAKRLGTPQSGLTLRAGEIVAIDPARMVPPPVPDAAPGEPLEINWVFTPPAPGSGGHTTIFRLVSALEAAGHTCRVYLYDRYDGDVRAHEAVIRAHWPQVRASVHDVADGMPAAHAVFATSWETAYVVAGSAAPGKRFYLVQDYEPFFYPVGSESTLAANSYRFGFHGITIGSWLAEKLSSEHGMRCDHFSFGCDTERYHLGGESRRDGVVFYARPSAPRRAFELGVLALEEFARACPDVEIHLFGERLGGVPFRYTDHGLLPVDALNDLYNRCAAGLSLSMTNISLIPLEQLAAGCIPVVNDAPHNRMVLDNPFVRYAPPSPPELARALQEVMTRPDAAEVARRASASVQAVSWDSAGATVEQVLRRELTAAAPSRPRLREPA